MSPSTVGDGVDIFPLPLAVALTGLAAAPAGMQGRSPGEYGGVLKPDGYGERARKEYELLRRTQAGGLHSLLLGVCLNA